jgi:hypothetical protein
LRGRIADSIGGVDLIVSVKFCKMILVDTDADVSGADPPNNSSAGRLAHQFKRNSSASTVSSL